MTPKDYVPGGSGDPQWIAHITECQERHCRNAYDLYLQVQRLKALVRDREPQPSDGPDHHADHAAWERRQTDSARAPE